jgi:small subunit ribosomal protein S17
MSEENVKKGNVVVGRVVSNKMHKTITVLVERRVKHALYGKYVTRSSKLKAHDQDSQCKEGDLVSIKECRPLSSSKHWTLVAVLEKAPAPVASAEA